MAVGSTVTFGSIVAVGSAGKLVGVGLGGTGVFVGTGVRVGADVGVGRVGVTVAIDVGVAVGTTVPDGEVVAVGSDPPAGFGGATAVGVGVSVGMIATVGTAGTGVSGIEVGSDVAEGAGVGVGEFAATDSAGGVTPLLPELVRGSPPSLQATTRISISESAVNAVRERLGLFADRTPIRNGRDRPCLIAKSPTSSYRYSRQERTTLTVTKQISQTRKRRLLSIVLGDISR